MENRSPHSPPEWPVRFLEKLCPRHLVEGIEGDLLEQFENDIAQFGLQKARRKFIWNALRFADPEIILRKSFSFSIINTIMWRNYLTIAFRTIAKNKAFTFINIVGLALGLAACLLIFQFVTFELSYDKFNEHFDRTYRVTNDRFQGGKLIQHGTITYPTIGPTMAKDYPEIEMYTRLMPGGDMNVKVEEKIFKNDNCHFVDEHFLFVFTFPLLAGDKIEALKKPYSIVLTENTAKKYFDGNRNYSDLLGKVIYWGIDSQPYTITGICENVPNNSHIRFDALVSYATLIRPEDTDADKSWTWSDMRHYLVLKKGVDPKELEKKFPAFSERYFQGDKVSGSVEKFYLQPLRDAHLFSDYEYDIAVTASGKAVWAMVIIAIFILVIAWINYINLTTSKAIERAKEVGLRKVMGAFRVELVRQFIFESMLFSLVAFAVGFIIVTFGQSYFNQIIKQELSFRQSLISLSPGTTITIFAVLALCVVLSGFYPAFILSAYKPVTILKGKFQRSSRGQWLRKGLVIFQFTASAALITSTLIVSQQIKFMSEKDLGINLHRILVIEPPERTPYDSTFINRMEGLKEKLRQVNGVVSVATSGQLPGDRLGRTFNVKLKEEASKQYTMSFFRCDFNFFDTYDVPLVAGRKFTSSDHHVNGDEINTVIINRNGARLLGHEPEEIVGKQINFWGRDWNIVGVVGDFHQESLRKPMEPIFFVPMYGQSEISIRLATANYQEALPQFKSAFESFFPDNVFSTFLIEDRYKNQYDDDTRFGKVVNTFTVLAIIVSCLGLLGLASYSATVRTKEIGIRKVMGASAANIMKLLSMDLFRLVLVAILISIPITYRFMENWLSGYAYRIEISWISFVAPLFIIVIIVSLTIISQIIKAAFLNPVNSLRTE